MKKILFILCLFCFFIACDKKDDVTNTGQINGYVKMYINNDSVGIVGVKLYLLNADVTIDTVQFNNQKAFVDSVLTDSIGKYCFNNLKPGRYAVVPKYLSGYKITPIGRSTDELMELGEDETITLNFSDEINLMGSELNMSVRIDFTNMKQSDYDINLEVAKYRRAWVFFVPYMQYVSTSPTYGRYNWNDGTFSCSCQADFPRALTFLFYSWDNYLSFDLINSFDNSATSPIKESFQCYLPFEKSSVYLKYDGKTKKVEVVQ